MKEHIHAIHRENVKTLSACSTNDLRLIVVKLSHTNPNHINNEKKKENNKLFVITALCVSFIQTSRASKTKMMLEFVFSVHKLHLLRSCV